VKGLLLASAATVLLAAAALAQTPEAVASATGYVLPVKQTDLKPEKAGRIVKLHFGLGDRVKAGALLFEIKEDDTAAIAKVYAPHAGMILRAPVIEGQLARASADLETGTVLATIADTTSALVETRVAESEAAKLRVKQKTIVKGSLPPDAIAEGEITFIAPIATVQGSVKSVTVQATFNLLDGSLLQGQRVQLSFLDSAPAK
jgi:multidrug efflux pump subunit AcrA (membrane-fusion protein)